MDNKNTEKGTKKTSPKPLQSPVVAFPIKEVDNPRKIENLTTDLLKRKEDLVDLLVVGWDKNDYLFYNSNNMLKKDVLWLIEKLKLHLMKE